MNLKLILALITIATVATAAVGLAAAQFGANQTPYTNTANQQPCLTGPSNQTQVNCINGTTGQPYCNQTCTAAGNCYGCGSGQGCQENSCANSYGYGCGEQTQNQQQTRFGDERNGWGCGGCR
ncbi:MAG: hypothetical protein NWE93_12910 [Candidatus Bathyarchaeota archaeon]|nr:hypothetical protein [Candidatus Bathyarchaeota archaeon]